MSNPLPSTTALNSTLEPIPSPESYKTYKTRWLTILILFLQNLTSSLVWVTYAAVPKPASQYYDTSLFAIDLYSFCFLVTFCIFAIPVSALVHRKGLRFAFCCGALLQVIGPWVRVLGTVFGNTSARYGVGMLGQVSIHLTIVYRSLRPTILFINTNNGCARLV